MKKSRNPDVDQFVARGVWSWGRWMRFDREEVERDWPTFQTRELGIGKQDELWQWGKEHDDGLWVLMSGGESKVYAIKDPLLATDFCLRFC